MAVRCHRKTIWMQAYERPTHHNFNGTGIQLNRTCSNRPAFLMVKRLATAQRNPVERNKLRANIILTAKSGSQGGTPSATTQNMVNSYGTSAKEDEAEREGGSRHGEFIPWAVGGPDESVVPVHLPNGNEQIDKNRERCRAREKSRQDQQATDEFGEGGHIAEPCRQSETGDHLRMVMQSSENFVRAMRDHDDSQGETHYQQGERLQTIEIAQRCPSRGNTLSQPVVPGAK